MRYEIAVGIVGTFLGRFWDTLGTLLGRIPDGFGRSQTKMKGGTGPDGGCADSRPWAFTDA